MPGFIKVSNTQRPLSSAYVKVSGTWRPVVNGYVKVNGAWKTWITPNVVDDFNRTDAASLGTCSNGVASWTATSGSWAISSNAATSATSASSYPLASISSVVSSPDFEVGVDIPAGNGPGVAFWVTDANNWWAAVTDTVVTNNYSCPTGGTLSGTNCVITSTYAATSSTYNCGSSYSYDCSYPATLSYGSLYQGSSCYACTGPGGNGGTLQCVSGACYEVNIPNYTCPNGGTATGIEPNVTCVKTCTGCGTGGSDSCQTCTSYSCSSGDTLSGTTCTHTSTYTATNTPTYTYSVKILKKIAGTVSTAATYTYSSAVRSLKVSTSNNSVTISAYSAVGQSGLLAANSYTATSPTTTSTAGMIISPATSSQSAVLDNFYIK